MQDYLCEHMTKNMLVSLQSFNETFPIQMIPLWNSNCMTTQKLIKFLNKVLSSVPIEDRVAVCDFDGTIVEAHPAPVDLFQSFAASQGWLKGYQNLEAFTKTAKTYSTCSLYEKSQWYNTLEQGTTISVYQKRVRQFLEKPRNINEENEFLPLLKFHNRSYSPSFVFHKKTYLQCLYSPMIHLLQLLKKLHFQIWIVNASCQYFIREFAPYLGISPDRMIGNEPTLEWSEKSKECLISKNFIPPDCSGKGKVKKSKRLSRKSPFYQ